MEQGSKAQVLEMRTERKAEQVQGDDRHHDLGRRALQLAQRESVQKTTEQQQVSDVIPVQPRREAVSPPSSETAASSGDSESAGEEECLESAADPQGEESDCRGAVHTSTKESLTNGRKAAEFHRQNRSPKDEESGGEAALWESFQRKVVVRRISSADSATTTSSEDGAARGIGLLSACSSPGRCFLRTSSIAEEVFVPVAPPDESISSRCSSPQPSSSSSLCRCTTTSSFASLSESGALDDDHTKLGVDLSSQESEKLGNSVYLQHSEIGDFLKRGVGEHDLSIFLGRKRSPPSSGGVVEVEDAVVSSANRNRWIPPGLQHGGCPVYGSLSCGHGAGASEEETSAGGMTKQEEDVGGRQATRSMSGLSTQPQEGRGTRNSSGETQPSVDGSAWCCEDDRNICIRSRTLYPRWESCLSFDTRCEGCKDEHSCGACATPGLTPGMCPAYVTSMEQLSRRTCWGKADGAGCSRWQPDRLGAEVDGSCDLHGVGISGHQENRPSEVLQSPCGLPGAQQLPGDPCTGSLPLLGPEEAARRAAVLADACARTFAALGWLTKSDTTDEHGRMRGHSGSMVKATIPGQCATAGGERLREQNGNEEREGGGDTLGGPHEGETGAARLHKNARRRVDERDTPHEAGALLCRNQVRGADCVIQDVEDLRRASKRHSKEARKRRRRLQKLLESPFGSKEMEEILAKKGELESDGVTAGISKSLLLARSECVERAPVVQGSAEESHTKLDSSRGLHHLVGEGSSPRWATPTDRRETERAVELSSRRQDSDASEGTGQQRSTSQTRQQLVCGAVQLETVTSPMRAGKSDTPGEQTSDPVDGRASSEVGGFPGEEKEAESGRVTDTTYAEKGAVPLEAELGDTDCSCLGQASSYVEREGSICLSESSKLIDQGDSALLDGESALSRFSSFSTSCSFSCRRASQSSTAKFSRAASTVSSSFDLSPCTVRGTSLSSAAGDGAAQDYVVNEDKADQLAPHSGSPSCERVGEEPKETWLLDSHMPAERAHLTATCVSYDPSRSTVRGGLTKPRWTGTAVCGACTVCGERTEWSSPTKRDQDSLATAVGDQDLLGSRAERDDDKDSCCSANSASTAACIELMLEMICAAGDEEAFTFLEAPDGIPPSATVGSMAEE
ncbi:hypothetical protein CSUI_006117 [Cystoisospora suis]|uniref:Uncharacterized protein n=1 Tax=Cystoisospora suis TaxID=483139 RepID=A0A2C6KV50_9APIC|nr:hypothetical protein CSUI_006117 [Cystoisospora suis]